MAWVALKAVYMAQPRRIAKPATCSVRSNSLRRTCRNLARRGAAVTLRGLCSSRRKYHSHVESECESATVCMGAVPCHPGRLLQRAIEGPRQVADAVDRVHRGDSPPRVPGLL